MAITIQAVKRKTRDTVESPAGPASVSHGSQLSVSSVGPWALQGVAKGSETLWSVNSTQTIERISTYPGWGRPSWIPGTDYVYNNLAANHGGVVPAGGMVIDGYTVPAGTWVCQFADFQGLRLIVEGNSNGAGSAWPGVIFRGCRWRGPISAPGFISGNSVASNGITWLMFCDAGGTSYTIPDITESIFESQGNGPNDRMYVIRCYLSIATTLVFLRNSGDAAIECVGEDVIGYYNDSTYHLNGIANGGNEAATMWLRNRLDFSPQPGDSPWWGPQNDVVQMAADNGPYLGAGTNLDGSTGYQIRDNFLAGAAHTLQLGVDKANTAADVRNVVATGNEFSTKYFENCGQTAISYKTPTWGSYGNTWSGNTWADDFGTGSWDPSTANAGRQYPAGNGPRVGGTVSAPSPG